MFKKISAFFFFYFSIIGVYIVFLPKILSQLGYSSFEIGVIYAAAPLIRFALPFAFGKFIALDKKAFYASLANLIFTGFLFYISIENFYAFLLANILFGASIGIILPFIESYSLKLLGKKTYGKSRLFGSLGFMITALVLSRFLEQNLGLHVLFVNIILTVLVSFMIVAKNENFASRAKTKDKINLIKHLPYWLSLVLMQVSFGAFYNFFTIYETSYGVSLEQVGWLWTFGVCCEIVLFYTQASLLKRFSLGFLIKSSYLITVIRWLLLYLFPSSLGFTYLSQSLHAFSFALFHTAAFSYLHAIYKNSSLASQFYYGISYGLGALLGSLIAGATYGEYVYLISAFIAILAFFAYTFENTKSNQPRQNC